MVSKNYRPVLLCQLDKFWCIGLNKGWYGVACVLSLADMEHIWTLSRESFTYVNYVNRHDTFGKLMDIRRKGEIPIGADAAGRKKSWVD